MALAHADELANLRSALDHALYALTDHRTAPEITEKCAFPAVSDIANWKSVVNDPRS